MGSEGSGLTRVITPAPSGFTFLGRATMFMVPSLVSTAVSIAVFATLHGFTHEQFNYFAIPIVMSTILSLLATAGTQLLVHRAVDEEPSPGPALRRGIGAGIIYGTGFSLLLGAMLSPYLFLVVHLPLQDYVLFVILLLVFPTIWTITAAFWATGKYAYPAVVFTVSYIVLLLATYTGHYIDPQYTLPAYTAAIMLLFLLSVAAMLLAFRGPGGLGDRGRTAQVRLPVLGNVPAILLYVFLTLAVFLDKIIVWVWNGIAICKCGLMIGGTYTTGSFLGLVPLFSIGAMVYFTSKAGTLMRAFYLGRASEIHLRAEEYKKVYRAAFTAILLASLLLFLLVAAFIKRYMPDPEVVTVYYMVGAGAVCFSVLMLNSTVLPLFGRTRTPMLAAILVCLFELLSIPFLSFATWYPALGFLAGSFAAYLITQFRLLQMFSSFEYNLFRQATVNALSLRKE